MTAAVPHRCISSLLTTELLNFRNPQKAGEEWRLQNEDRGPLVPFAARVIVAEIGCAFLCVTAAIEMFVYSNSALLAAPLLFFSERPFNWVSTNLSSSRFTLFWNIRNVFALNLSHINVATDESFARFSMDYCSPLSQSIRTFLKSDGLFTRIEDMVYVGFWLKNHATSRNYEAVEQVIKRVFQAEEAKHEALTAAYLALKKQKRDLDAEKLVLRKQKQVLETQRQMLQEEHQTLLEQNQVLVAETQALQEQHRLLLDNIRRLQEQGQMPQDGPPEHLREAIGQGTVFFKEEILGEGKIDPALKMLVAEFDPDIVQFVLMRCIYCYVFGSKKREPIPEFFKESTCQKLADLRGKYLSGEAVGLTEAVYSHLFDASQLIEEDLIIFNDLRAAAYGELQASFFLKCWQAAVEEQH